MTSLHKKLNNDDFVPKEGQRGFLCSNNQSFRCPSLSYKFSANEEKLNKAFNLLFEEVTNNKINNETNKRS
jgi:hypothetical protein